MPKSKSFGTTFLYVLIGCSTFVWKVGKASETPRTLPTGSAAFLSNLLKPFSLLTTVPNARLSFFLPMATFSLRRYSCKIPSGCRRFSPMMLAGKQHFQRRSSHT